MSKVINKTLNKVDLSTEVTEHLVDIPLTTVKKVIGATWDVIKLKLSKGEPVSIAGFGNFCVKDRAARTGRNPKTGAAIQIAATKTPNFKAGKLLKDAVKE